MGTGQATADKALPGSPALWGGFRLLGRSGHGEGGGELPFLTACVLRPPCTLPLSPPTFICTSDLGHLSSAVRLQFHGRASVPAFWLVSL